MSDKLCACGKQIPNELRMCLPCAARTMPPIEDESEMATINLAMIRPLLSGAIDRHGAHVADIAEHSTALQMHWEASESMALGLAHADTTNLDEMIFAAERWEEAAMKFLVAAYKLRKDAGQ